MSKNKNNSSLTFLELTENLAYVKVIWNGKVIYDDLNGDEDTNSLVYIKRKYDNLIVYNMNVQIVQFHHCVLTIDGEDPAEDALRVATWEISYDGWYPYCSNCKQEPINYLRKSNYKLPNVCPHCGCTMNNTNELNQKL